MILGGVPIRVINPPRIVAKASGIRVIRGDRLALAEACKSTGINMARAATLFIKAENTALSPPIAAI